MTVIRRCRVSAMPLAVLFIAVNFSAATALTRMFNGPLSGTTWVSGYQIGKSKTSLDSTEARESE